MKRTIITMALCVAAIITLHLSTFAQAKTTTDIVNASEITWLGIDFSLAKFVGTAYQFKDKGEITDAEFRDKYAPGINQLFIDEAKKYDVAGATTKRIKNAIEVTDRVNAAASKTPFFTNDVDQYKKLDEAKVKAQVKKYDFKDNTGIGLVYIVDGLSKVKEEMGVWVTYVDIKTKAVLHSFYTTGKVGGMAGGVGFRNYWAKAFTTVLKNTREDYKTLK